eukprot:TRINITY_DN1313_c1_g1_i4.p1 TRINITY_DN1313_c1_g1~~TRINITY_DN1313_c1_g1_i4.p1  ORF type:complete len:283 (+),score=57.30 TRINITY_DN1313_c1_g1_i4:138-986(+)
MKDSGNFETRQTSSLSYVPQPPYGAGAVVGSRRLASARAPASSLMRPSGVKAFPGTSSPSSGAAPAAACSSCSSSAAAARTAPKPIPMNSCYRACLPTPQGSVQVLHDAKGSLYEQQQGAEDSGQFHSWPPGRGGEEIYGGHTAVAPSSSSSSGVRYRAIGGGSSSSVLASASIGGSYSHLSSALGSQPVASRGPPPFVPPLEQRELAAAATAAMAVSGGASSSTSAVGSRNRSEGRSEAVLIRAATRESRFEQPQPGFGSFREPRISRSSLTWRPSGTSGW